MWDLDLDTGPEIESETSRGWKGGVWAVVDGRLPEGERGTRNPKLELVAIPVSSSSIFHLPS